MAIIKKIGIDARMCGKEFTGIGRCVYEIIHRLPRLMPDCEFVFFLNSGSFKELEFQEKNVKKVEAKEPIYSYSEQVSFLRLVNKEKCDLMYFMHFNVPFFYRRDFVVLIHDLTLIRFPGKKMNKLVHRIGFYLVFVSACLRARKIVTVSDHTKKDLVSSFRISPDKVQTIYNGVDIEKFQKKSQIDLGKLGISKPFFLYTGVWREHKNIKGLVRAFALCVKRGLDAELVLTGGKGVYRDEIVAKIRKYGVEDRVVLTGFVDDAELVGLFQNARCFVFPSFSEGFGLPPLEAMAAGTPNVSSSSSCMGEIYGDNVLYFNPYDIEDMSMQMMKLFGSQNLRNDLIQRGLRHVQKFNWGKNAIETRDFLGGILLTER